MTNKLNVQPMNADVDPLVVDDLRERLSRTRLSGLDDDGDRGISGPWLEELLEDWKGLNATTFPHSTSGLTHLSANIDGQRVHLAMAEGRGPNPTPLLLCNGWPSSFYEYLDVLPLLTDPAAHGGTAQDAFTVVSPTTPGFGFSAPPPPGGHTAAQIGEKVIAWSSPDPDGRPAFPRDLLLANLTLYWATGTIATSMLPYWKYRHTPSAALPIDDPSSVPTSVSLFGGERVPFPRLPRELAERYFSITRWEEHKTGGHFPAAATPELFAETLRMAFCEMRP